jgi:hypothetical protein
MAFACFPQIANPALYAGTPQETAPRPKQTDQQESSALKQIYKATKSRFTMLKKKFGKKDK